MTTVTDTTGKAWKLVFTLNMIKPLTATLGHDPREILTDPLKLVALLSDPEKVAAVAYVFTEPVAVGIPKASAEEFAAALDAEALDQAAEAIIRLVAGMYAPRGKKVEVAEGIIGMLKDAAEVAQNEKSEPAEPVAA